MEKGIAQYFKVAGIHRKSPFITGGRENSLRKFFKECLITNALQSKNANKCPHVQDISLYFISRCVLRIC